MVFVADDLGMWLIATHADAGRKRLTTQVAVRSCPISTR
jgi:hypothetical protein